jgi:nicotinate-nucleotide pyrophosphorylase (carboxylating)
MQQIPFYKKYKDPIDQFIISALAEDIGHADHTSLSCLSNQQHNRVEMIAKESGIIAGVELAQIIFKQVNDSIQCTVNKQEGSLIVPGDVVMTIEGPQYDLLATERLVLNCMQRMSGIASLTHRLSQKIAHTKCTLLDTRKTTPNFRYPEKWAVHIGGGNNHRMGLFDMIMIKDNHIDFNGSISKTLSKTQAYLIENKLSLKTIVEVRNLTEIEECFEFPWIHRLLLDNMSPQALKKAITLIQGKFATEASGNINESNLVEIAETGVDYASLGALTHSAKNIDLSLKKA